MLWKSALFSVPVAMPTTKRPSIRQTAVRAAPWKETAAPRAWQAGEHQHESRAAAVLDPRRYLNGRDHAGAQA
jgi:hypothetical protein